MEEHPHLKKIKVTDDANQISCVFCKTKKIDELKLGPLYEADGVAAHYFCLLFSAALRQNGSDKEGILGFLTDDIKKEVRRAAFLKCTYCSVKGASVGCCNRQCKACYHFPCGRENDANYEFLGNYESYCKSHYKKQVLKIENVKTAKDDENDNEERRCPICLNALTRDDDIVIGTCCKLAVLHKVCAQEIAMNAGYFFKCPLCNDGKRFPVEMRQHGIFVPERDASWESEPNAFQELYYQYTRCDAVECACTKGRNHGASKGAFLLARCRICGAAGVHRQCGRLQTIDNWACEPCLEVEKRADDKKQLRKKQVTATIISNTAPSSRRTKTVIAAESAPSKSTRKEKFETVHVSAKSRASKIKAIAGPEAPVSSSSRSSRRLTMKAAAASESATLSSVSVDITSQGTSQAMAALSVADKIVDFRDSTHRNKRSYVRQSQVTNNPSKPRQPVKLKDEVDYAHLIIAAECFDYFPYGRPALVSYGRDKKDIPDWRNFQLKVNLVNIFDEDRKDDDAKANEGQAIETLTPISSAENKNKNVQNTKRRMVPGDKRSRRGSSWRKGIVKKRKAVKPKSQLAAKKSKTGGETLDSETNAKSEKKEDSTKMAEAILVGIRKSQQWLQPSTEASKDARDVQVVSVSNLQSLKPLPNGISGTPSEGIFITDDSASAPVKYSEQRASSASLLVTSSSQNQRTVTDSLANGTIDRTDSAVESHALSPSLPQEPDVRAMKMLRNGFHLGNGATDNNSTLNPSVSDLEDVSEGDFESDHEIRSEVKNAAHGKHFNSQETDVINFVDTGDGNCTLQI